MITENFKRIYGNYTNNFEEEDLKIYCLDIHQYRAAFHYVAYLRLRSQKIDDDRGYPTQFVIFYHKRGKKYEACKKEELQELGINLTIKQYNIIEKCAAEKSKGKSSSNLIDQIKKFDFTITPELSQKLIINSIEDKYKIIKSSIGEEHWDKLNVARQIGVMDYAIHIGNVDKLKESIIAGDFIETAKKMRKFKARAELRAELVTNGKTDFEGVYFVKSGDTLTKISQTLGLKLSDLTKLNPGLVKLHRGQKINIPHTVKTSIIDIIDDEGCFKLEIVHYKFKMLGAFFVRLKANDQVTNIGQSAKDSSLFTKRSSNTPAENIIIDLFKSTQGVTDTKILNIREEQYNKILQYIDSGIRYGDTKVLESACEINNKIEYNYIVSADDSAVLVQNLYHATGLPLYFTAAYSKSELLNLGSIDARKALESYGSRDDIMENLKSICGESKEEVAKMLNLDPAQVAFKQNGCVRTVRACRAEGVKFCVKIDSDLLDSITSIIDISSTSDKSDTKNKDACTFLQGEESII